jgi:hypothetical protein
LGGLSYARCQLGVILFPRNTIIPALGRQVN